MLEGNNEALSPAPLGRPTALTKFPNRRSRRGSARNLEHDIAFLQGAANMLGMALERQRYEDRLKAALDRHQVLLSPRGTILFLLSPRIRASADSAL